VTQPRNTCAASVTGPRGGSISGRRSAVVPGPGDPLRGVWEDYTDTPRLGRVVGWLTVEFDAAGRPWHDGVLYTDPIEAGRAAEQRNTVEGAGAADPAGRSAVCTVMTEHETPAAPISADQATSSRDAEPESVRCRLSRTQRAAADLISRRGEVHSGEGVAVTTVRKLARLGLVELTFDPAQPRRPDGTYTWQARPIPAATGLPASQTTDRRLLTGDVRDTDWEQAS
jgi:hypothetical protein